MNVESKSRCPQCGAPLPADAPGGLCPNCLMAMNLETQSQVEEPTGPHGTRIVPPPSRVPTPAELAKLFPQLEIIECLGRGGMGIVYKARQPRLNRFVALKILAPERVQDAAFASRFEREAQTLARLNHPNVVTLYEFGQTHSIASLAPTALAGGKTRQQPEAGGTTAPLYYFLMEFVDGVNLRQLMQRERISPREALAIVPQICDALQYAHDQGVVHRDIKPENILMDRRGQVKVADFGLAKILGKDALTPSLSHPMGEGGAAAPGEGPAALTDAGQVMGTPQYMSPEQIHAPGAVDHRADIYALGVVFYQMLTGELPGKKIEPPSRKVSIDVRLDEVVLRALQKKPELRYQQASILKTQVETIAQRDAAPSAVPATQGLVHRTSPASLLVFLLLYLGLLGFLAVSAPALPERVATHFDGEGRPNDWMSRAGYLCFVGALPMLFGGLAVGIGWATRTLPARFFNIPRRDFWLTPERRPALAVFLRARMFWLSCLVTGFFAGLHALTVQANQFQPPHLSMGGLLGIVMGFLIVLLLWIVSLFMRLADANRPLPIPTHGAGAPPAKSRMVRLVEAVFDTRFTDPLAVGLVRFSALGFLAALAFLKVLPGWHWCGAFAGFAGFFGLIGAAFLVEFFHRRTATGPEASSGVPPRRYHRIVLALVLGSIITGILGYSVLKEFLKPVTFSRVPLRRLDVTSEATRQEDPSSTDMQKASPTHDGSLSFGPVIERTLNDSIAQAGNNCIDLDSGKVGTLPKPANQADFNWMLTNGIDAFPVRDGTASEGLMGTGGMVARQIGNDRWETIRPDEILAATLGLKPDFRGGIALVDAAAVVGKPSLPVTFMFRTRDGAMGILQVLSHTGNPPGVKFRYKLVQGVADADAPSVLASSGAEASVASAPAPVVPAIYVLPHKSWAAGLAFLFVLVPLLALAALVTVVLVLRKRMKPGTGKNLAIGCSILVLGGLMVVLLGVGGFFSLRWSKRRNFEQAAQERVQQEKLAVERTAPTFGPAIERVLQSRLEGTTNWFLDLETGNILMPPPELAESLVRRTLEAIPGTRAMQFTDWVQRTGVDLAVYGPEAFETLGGIWVPTHGSTYEDWDDLEALTPGQTLSAIRAEEKQPTWSGRPELPGIGPKSVLYRDFSVNYFFKTREGTPGVLQVAGKDEASGGLKLRYKLVTSTDPLPR